MLIGHDQPVSLTTTGKINLGRGAQGDSCKIKDLPSGALIAKIGEEGTPFLVGSSYITSSDNGSGELFLGITDMGCASDNAGKLLVTIDRNLVPT